MLSALRGFKLRKFVADIFTEHFKTSFEAVLFPFKTLLKVFALLEKARHERSPKLQSLDLSEPNRT